jgi:hypothetical protein
MTKLEEEIAAKTKGFTRNADCNRTVANLAAEVAKKYIEKYHHDICEWDCQHLQPEEFLTQWLKENGVI